MKKPSGTLSLLLGLILVMLGCAESGQTSVPLSRAESRYGSIRPEEDGLWQGRGREFYFPSVSRLIPHPGKGPWSFEIQLTREEYPQMTPQRRQVEDFAIWLNGGMTQVWWGGSLTSGIRVNHLGRTVAADAEVFLKEPSHRIGLALNAGGQMTVRLDGEDVIRDTKVGASGPGWLDLSSRNSAVRWSQASCSFDPDTIPEPPQDPEWEPLPGEPDFSPYEKIYRGYHPFPTHLWNRWLSDFVPGATGWQGWPWYESEGESPVTHGPMLGKPGNRTIAVWCRTRNPARIEVIAGAEGFPTRYRSLGFIETRSQRGNTGSLRLDQWPFEEEQAHYSLRVDDRIVDTRDPQSRWPLLRRTWFQPDPDRTLRIALTYGDNLLPLPFPVSRMQPWEDLAREIDLMIHLGDFVYEQSFRRRVEVSRLDYLSILSFGAGRRNRSLPMVGMFDDHEIHNDVVGLGAPHWFAAPQEGTRLPSHNPWRVASREPGSLAWEEFVGWSSPIEERYRKAPIIMGTGRLSLDGVLQVDQETSAQTDRIDPATASSLIVWPEALPYDLESLPKEPAGVYRIKQVRERGRVIILDPPPRVLAPQLKAPAEGDTFEVHFSLSRPRFGSLDLGPAELLILDTRTEKGLWAVDPLKPGPSLLGRAQREWLLGKIKSSKAPVLLISSSVTFTFHNSFSLSKRDSWTGFQHEREQVLRAILKRDKPVILLTGDLHATAVRRLNEKVFEIICGAWSNEMYKGVATQALEEAAVFGSDTELVYNGPDDNAELSWESHASIFDIDPGGGVKLKMVDASTGSVDFEMTLFSGE